MGKGLLSGLVWGAAVSAILLGSVSLMLPAPEPGESVAPPPAAPEAAVPEAVEPDPAAPEGAAPEAAAAARPEAAVVEVPPGSEFARGLPDAAPLAPAPERTPEAAAPAPVAAPAAEPAPDLAEIAPAAQPQGMAEAPGAPAAPAPAPDPLAPLAPSLAAPAAGGAAPPMTVPATAETAPAPEAAPPAPAPAETALAPQPAEATRPEVAGGPAQPAAPAAGVEAAPAPSGSEPAPGLIRPDPPALQGGGSEPAPGAPSARGVRTGRLPTIGGDPAPAPGPAPEPEAGAELDPMDLPAIRRNAVPFEDMGGRPLVSVVLIDDGAAAAPEDLAGLGLPLTVAVNPVSPDASDRAAALRAAGIEVLILAEGIPPGAEARDLEVTFQSYLTTLPQAVGVIDRPADGFQNNRRMAQHMVALLAADGLGLVTYARGLNPAEQIARTSGVESAVASRLIEQEGEGAGAIRRHLDRAAFDAAREGSAVVVGHGRPETLEALADWARTRPAASVALAPVSAVALAR